MKVVAVSQRVDFLLDRNESRDSLDQRLIKFLLKAGYLAIPVPNSFIRDSNEGPSINDALGDWIENINPHGVILSGGNDIGSCRDRDLTEMQLLEYAKKTSLPVLGICRGMQMMGLWAGTELLRVEGHVHSRHALTGVINWNVNSYHNFALSTCPPDFVELARSEDGVIEAICHHELQWEGWMWHPERELVFLSQNIDRLRDLFR